MLITTAPQSRKSSPPTPTVPAALAAELRRIRAEYEEMPGLHLTLPQAQRLWQLDAARCASLLEALVDVHFLKRTAMGGYVRGDRD